MVQKAWSVEWFPTKTEQEALLLETELIANHTPPYNNLIKWSHAYVYIRIENSPFPRISIVRKKTKDKAIYIGPKVMHRHLKDFLRMARYIFQRRSCSQQTLQSGHVCSDYYFGQCGWWCVIAHWNKKDQNAIKLMSYEQALEENRTMIRIIRALFSWKITEFQTHIKKKITDAIKKEHFEWATKLRDLHNYAEHLKNKQTIIVNRMIHWYYCIIQEQWDRYIRVVITINEWRIIDIIGNHEHHEDTTINKLLWSIEREYSITLKQNIWADKSRYFFEQKSIGKHILKNIHENATAFIEWYTFSRFAGQEADKRLNLLKKLQEKYSLANTPISIECIDISHFWWEHIVWWLSASYYWVLAKNNYRRYAIKTIADNNDYKAIEEVLIRRFTKKTNVLPPNLMIIDWWKWQLWVVKTLQKNNKLFHKNAKNTIFISIGKWLARSRAAKQSWAVEYICILQWDSIETFPVVYDEADRLIILLRDEAHRFANAYRKKKQAETFTWK